MRTLRALAEVLAAALDDDHVAVDVADGVARAVGEAELELDRRPPGPRAPARAAPARARRLPSAITRNASTGSAGAALEEDAPAGLLLEALEPRRR